MSELAVFEEDFRAWRECRAALLADDFGELGRYRDANAALKAAGPVVNRVVFFGDSITEGWDLAQHFPGKPYVNRGISGQTTPQMLIRFRQDVVALAPRLTVILAGINDLGGNTGPALVEDITANLASMAEIAMVNSIEPIFSLLLPPAHRETPSSRYSLLKHPPEEIAAVNEWLKNYCEGRGLGLIGYPEALSGPDGCLLPEFSEDGLHPTAAAYGAMTTLAQAAIDEALTREGL